MSKLKIHLDETNEDWLRKKKPSEKDKSEKDKSEKDKHAMIAERVAAQYAAKVGH